MGLGPEVGDGGGVVWAWMGRVDYEVVLEPGNGVVLFFLFLGLVLGWG